MVHPQFEGEYGGILPDSPSHRAQGIIEPMIDVTKPKLGRDRSYALKTSALESALSAARIEVAVDSNYWTPERVSNAHPVFGPSTGCRTRTCLIDVSTFAQAVFQGLNERMRPRNS